MRKKGQWCHCLPIWSFYTWKYIFFNHQKFLDQFIKITLFVISFLIDNLKVKGMAQNLLYPKFGKLFLRLLSCLKKSWESASWWSRISWVTVTLFLWVVCSKCWDNGRQTGNVNRAWHSDNIIVAVRDTTGGVKPLLVVRMTQIIT